MLQSHRRDGTCYVLFALALLALSRPASAQAARLNGPLAHPGANDVTNYAVSPDGAWVVFRADASTDEVYELYSAPSDGSEGPRVLNAPLVAGGDVYSFVVGQGRALYIADQDTNERYEVFSAPLDGSAAPIKLSLPLAPQATASFLWVDPAGTTLLFAVFEPFASLTRLFRAPVDGSSATVEIADSGASVGPTFGITFFIGLTFTSDGQHAVCMTQTFDDEYEPTRLIQVTVDGSQPPADISVPSEFGSIGGHVISQDGSSVAYADGIGNQNQLFAVAIDGTQRVQLNAAATIVTAFELAPDGQHVVYTQGSAGDLFLIASDGTQRVQLDPPGAAAGPGHFTPDGARVVFTAGGNLYSTPLAGAPVLTQLAGPGATDDLVLSADSASVAVVVESASFRGLYRVPTAGGASPVLLNGPPVPGRGVASAGQKLALTATRVVYRQDRDTQDVLELYSVPLDGSQPEKRISARLGQARDVQTFLLPAGGLRAVYLSDQNNDQTFEVFATALDGSSAPLRCNPPLASGPVLGDVLAYRTGASGSRVVFRADQNSDQVFELYSVREDGQGPALPISGDITASDAVQPIFARSAAGHRVVYQRDTIGGPFVLYGTSPIGQEDPDELDNDQYLFPGPFLLTPDETRVVYRKELFFGNRYGLFSQTLDASGPPIHLNPGAIAESSVEDVRLDPSGERAVYRADQNVDTVLELFSVPVDGSAPPVQLGNARVQEFQIAPGGRWVVYRAGERAAALLELFAVPIAGGPSLRVHPKLLSNRDVSDFAIAPDARRIVYRADQVVDQQLELYSAPLHGPFPALASLSGDARTGFVRLTPLTTGRDVQPDYVIQPDSQQVVYRVGAQPDSMDLFRVPLDGSTPPVQLSGTMVTGGGVMDFALSPDGTWVVYRADQRTNGLLELFRAPLAGGPAVALDDLPPLGDVESFQIAPDSLHVVYRADRATDEVFELFAVPLDLGAPPRRLNNPLAVNGDTETDYLALSGGRALFRADQQADEVFELFIGYFEHGPGHVSER